MKDTVQPLISEAAKYGLAFAVMAITIIGLCFAVSALWRNQNKREKEMQTLMRETIVAFQEMKATMNVLISKL